MSNRSLNNARERFNGLLAQSIERHAKDSPLKEAISYVLLAPESKRLRPLVIYAAGKSFNISRELLDAAACALEMIHCYSLVHDDLPAMDDDDLRRGRLSCHKKFGEATAILVGDALQSMAFVELSQQHLNPIIQNKMINVLSQASGPLGLAGGQALDLASCKNKTSQEQVSKIHQGKTASLFIAALCMAACTKNCDDYMTEIGVHMGLAFQLQDDILENIKTSEHLGKPNDSDKRNNKPSHVALVGMSAAKDLLDSYYDETARLIRSNFYYPEYMLQMLDMIDKRNIIT